MARLARTHSPTDYYHVMMRGNNKEQIFKTNEQKRYFLTLLINEEALNDIAAYCIMNNHVHIVLKADICDLSAGLKRLNIKYAMKYNFLNNRVGHVFQDRFKSEIITNDVYLTQVIRYVHNNPVMANIVQTPQNYPWSSYTEYLTYVKVISNTQREFILTLFSNNQSSFIQFTNEKDYTEYLDTKEEIQQLRLEHSQALISDYCILNGITNRSQIFKNSQYISEIIIILLENTNLSHREIAELIEVSRSFVNKISAQRDESKQ